jgi:hypothetical protein
MAKLIPSKLGGVDFEELALASLSKHFGERLLSGFVGNGTLMSGVVKVAISAFMPANNKVMRSVALGIGIDGLEDLLVSLLGGVQQQTGGVLEEVI